MREATAKKDSQEDLVVKTQILQYTYYHCKFYITPPPWGLIESLQRWLHYVSIVVPIVSSLFFTDLSVTYFYSSFLFLQNLFSPDTLHSIEETCKFRFSFQIQRRFQAKGKREPWFNECLHDQWAAFHLNCKSEFPDPFNFDRKCLLSLLQSTFLPV